MSWYTLAQAFRKGVIGHTPLLITVVHPLYTRGGKGKPLNGWEETREHDKRCRFWFGVGVTENMDVAWVKSSVTPISKLLGVYPFLSNAFFITAQLMESSGLIFWFYGKIHVRFDNVVPQKIKITSPQAYVFMNINIQPGYPARITSTCTCHITYNSSIVSK